MFYMQIFKNFLGFCRCGKFYSVFKTQCKIEPAFLIELIAECNGLNV